MLRGRADLPRAAGRPSTYYAARCRASIGPPGPRRGTEGETPACPRGALRRVRRTQALAPTPSPGVSAARCTVERLMGQIGLVRAVRGKRRLTTIADETVARPADLVQQHFDAATAIRLWVADLTYVHTWSGFVYGAFITDVESGIKWCAPRTCRGRSAISAHLATRRLGATASASRASQSHAQQGAQQC